jgi:hypothetical protein
MGVPREIFLYFLVDTTSGKSFYYLDQSGLVKTTNQPTFLNDSPEGWFDTQVSFARSQKYYGLNRAFTIPLKFIGDGAAIIRKHLYSGRGIEAPLSLVILKWDEDSDIYRGYYKGELDLTKVEDTAAEFLQVNLIEGGIVKLVKSYEATIYEFPCDGSIPENVRVRLDGMNFHDIFTYQLSAQSLSGTNAIGVGFISNIGDNIGITASDQSAEFIKTSIAQYVASSPNCFYATDGPVSLTIKGSLRFKPFGVTGTTTIGFYSSLGAQYLLFDQAADPRNDQTITINQTINLAAGEKLFLILWPHGPSVIGAQVYETQFTVEFFSKFKETFTWAISARDLYKLIVQKVGEGKYIDKSTLLDRWGNLMITCGFSLRGDDKAVIKTSLSDFFISLNAILNASLSNEDVGGRQALFLEDKGYVFDPSSITMDLGEVSELSTSIATDWFFNTIKIGYPAQTYDEKTGQAEFNTTYIFKAPVTRITKELDLVSKYRADSFGVEFTRFLFGGKSTTNNSSDNSVFILNVDEGAVTVEKYDASKNLEEAYASAPSDVKFETALGSTLFTPNADNSEFTFNGRAQNAILEFSIAATKADPATQMGVNLYQGTQLISTLTLTCDGNTDGKTVNVVLVPGDVIRLAGTYIGSGTIGFSVLHAHLGISLTSNKIYSLKRKAYTSITGVTDQTAFNIEDLTPARMRQRHENYLKSSLFNLTPDLLTFQSTDKNPNLSTTVGGVTYTEKADVPISSMKGQLVFTLIQKFKTKVPYTFSDLLSGAANGHIKYRFNGIQLYGFPQQVTAKPSINESQEWTVVLSPLTKLSDLEDLEIDGFNYFSLMGYQTFIPHLCPVKFVPLGQSVPGQYHFKSMDADWFKEQISMWDNQNNYFQKWQTNDVISIQVQTNGLAPVQVELIDYTGHVYQTVAMSQVTTTALQTPRAAYQGDVPLTGLTEALYYLHLTAGSGTTKTEFISEPLHVKEDWPETLLIEYKHKRNKQSMLFSNGYYPSLRVEGWIDKFNPEARFAVYEDQPADIEMINGIPYRSFKLNIAGNDGLPDWIIDKISRILLLSTSRVDGINYSRNGDAKFEVVEFPGDPKRYWSISIREAMNRDGITLDTSGQLDENLTVVYNIDTSMFGDGSGSTSVVEVTKTDSQ